MVASTALSTTIATSLVVAAAMGAYKVFKSSTAHQGSALPSLKSVARDIPDIAYPEDYYPGGQYVELSFGETHYFLFGPEDGKKIVFVHGLSTPASMYNAVARHMANNGCRVLLYDLYSRGYSVGPLVDHDPQLYVIQLHELLNHVGWKKCNIVGLSLGGGIVACFSHQFPEVVESLTFIAPGGLMLPSEIPRVGKVFLMPYSVEIFSHRWIKGYFSTRNIESMRNEFKLDGVPDCIEEAAKILELQFKVHAGYARGLMSTLRHFPLTKLRSQFASSQQQSYPVQILWGTKDKVIPGTTVDTIQQVIPRIKVTVVEGATHSIVMTHPGAVIEQLENFVR
ncbi:MAG: Alpha/Beta hydrolase protein [Benniella sp.]|nr:MAG: Alpha/Beta hydrolase protein [Benniella sp.]